MSDVLNTDPFGVTCFSSSPSSLTLVIFIYSGYKVLQLNYSWFFNIKRSTAVPYIR